MSDDNPSIVSHVSIGTNDLDSAVAFYDAVMATIGAGRKFEMEGAVAYGRQFPEFWVQTPYDGGEAAPCGNGFHLAFMAASREEVDAFYAAALEAGAADAGAPGPRPDYGPTYYACFIVDLDGNKIEACIH